jgi:hypothetical protein
MVLSEYQAIRVPYNAPRRPYRAPRVLYNQAPRWPYHALRGPYQALITYPITYPIRLHGGPIRSQIALSGCQSTLVGSQTALSEYQALALRVLYQALKSQMALIRLSEGPMAYKALSDSQSTLVAGSWGTLSGS